MIVGENLRRLRLKQTKLSQQDIAEALDVDRNTVANWEKGSRDIKSEYIPKLAELLKIDIKDLFENRTKEVKNNYKIKNAINHNDDNAVIIILNNKEAVNKILKFVHESI